jgi:hypothetical protein
VDTGFPKKIMLKQKDRARCRFNQNASRSSHVGYRHIEKPHNLGQLPSTGFTVSCFPVKIERASAGWTRAVAVIDG